MSDNKTSDNKVQVQFDPADLPGEDNAATTKGIVITLTNGDTVIYSGAGFKTAFRPR